MTDAGKALTPSRATSGDFFHKGTKIDRHGHTRTVPMQVLCLGRERTGTSSLREALFALDYAHVYHMISVIAENPPDAHIWSEAIDDKLTGAKTWGAREFDQLLGHCMAASDMPCVLFSEELIAAYPDAKVILTVRDSPRQWAESVSETTRAMANMSAPSTSFNPFTALWRWLLPRPPYVTMMEKAHALVRRDYDDGRLELAYMEHNERIAALCREHGRELLVFNVKEGWAPLCAFLGKEAPAAPFPRVNDRANFKQVLSRIRMLQCLGVTLNALKYAAIGAAVFGAARYWRRWR